MESTVKIKVTETSRSTYTSYEPYETTIDSLISGGWKFTTHEIDSIMNGKVIALYSPNGNRRLSIQIIY